MDTASDSIALEFLSPKSCLSRVWIVINDCINFFFAFWISIFSWINVIWKQIFGLPDKSILIDLLFEPQMFDWDRLAVLITNNKDENYVYPIRALRKAEIWDPHCKHGRRNNSNNSIYDKDTWYTLQLCVEYATYSYFWFLLGNPIGIQVLNKKMPLFVNLHEYNAGFFIAVTDCQNDNNNSSNDNDDGFDKGSLDDDSSLEEEYESGYIISHRKKRRNLKSNQILVCIRGTETLGDGLTDLYATPKRVKIGKNDYFVHPGIYDAACDINEEITNTIIEYIDKKTEIKKKGNDNGDNNNNNDNNGKIVKKRKHFEILVTGHSLGAGICSFLGLLWYCNNPFTNKFKNKKVKISFHCYSFASPCIIDHKGYKWSLNLKDKNGNYLITSVANKIDIVTRLSTKSIYECSNRINVIRKKYGYIRSWCYTYKIAQMRETSNDDLEFIEKLSKNENEKEFIKTLRNIDFIDIKNDNEYKCESNEIIDSMNINSNCKEIGGESKDENGCELNDNAMLSNGVSFDANMVSLYPCGAVIFNVPQCIYGSSLASSIDSAAAVSSSLSKIYRKLNRQMIFGDIIPFAIQWYFRTLFDIFSDLRCKQRTVQYKIDETNDIPITIFQNMVYNTGDSLQAHMPGHYCEIFDKDLIDVFRMSDSFIAKIIRFLEKIICCKWLLHIIVKIIIVICRKFYFE